MITLSIPSDVAVFIAITWFVVQVLRLRAARKRDSERASIERIRARGARWMMRDAEALDALVDRREPNREHERIGGVL